MEKVATYLTEIIAEEKELTDLEFRTTKFVLEVVLGETSKCIMYMVIFGVLGHFTNFIVALIAICVPRMFAGGYHSSTYWRCFFVTLAAFCITVFGGLLPLPNHIEFAVKAVMAVLSIVLAIYYAPADHPNMPIISPDRRRRKKNQSIICYVLFSAIGVYFSGIYALTFVIGLFIEAISLPVGRYLNHH